MLINYWLSGLINICWAPSFAGYGIKHPHTFQFVYSSAIVREEVNIQLIDNKGRYQRGNQRHVAKPDPVSSKPGRLGEWNNWAHRQEPDDPRKAGTYGHPEKKCQLGDKTHVFRLQSKSVYIGYAFNLILVEFGFSGMKISVDIRICFISKMFLTRNVQLSLSVGC